ncbi:MAG TPA: hypothetical protein V6D21_11270 [Candidatus Obscuribacterales bacterium]
MRSDKYELAKKMAPEYRHEKRTELYEYLQSKGYYWNTAVSWWSKRQVGYRGEPREGEVEIRLTSDSKAVRRLLEGIIRLLNNEGYETTGRGNNPASYYPSKYPGSPIERVYLTARIDKK